MCANNAEGYFSLGGYTLGCGFEKNKTPKRRSVGAAAAGMAVVVVLFFWINFGMQEYEALGILFDNLRIFAVVAAMAVDWPEVGGLGAWFAFFDLSQFDVDLVEPSCLGTPWGFVQFFATQYRRPSRTLLL